MSDAVRFFDIDGRPHSHGNPVPVNTYDSSGTEMGTLNNPIRVSEAGSKSAFGNILVDEEIPIEQAMYVYGIGDKTETFTATGGSASVSNGLIQCKTGTSVGGYGVARTKRALIYRPGEGGVCKFTAVFTTGVASSLQIAGLFSAVDALCFGYNGTSFGILHRYGGALEIQELQITVAAGGAETVTVTLDGTAYNIAVTAGTVQHNAYEIQADLATNATAWNTEVVDDTIYLVAQSVGDKTGTFSISSTGTCDGTFTETLQGATNTEDWTAQADFNIDAVDWLDPTKGNVYKIDFQYLGFGAIRFYVEDQDTGEFKLVHRINYTNRNTSPSMRNPSLKGGWATASLGSTTDLTLSGGSIELATQGKRVKREESHSYSNTASVGTTDTLIFSIRNRLVFGDIPNLAECVPILMTGTSESSKTTIISIYKNATINGEENFQFRDDDNQIIEVDTAGTTYTAGDGKLIASSTVSTTGVSPPIDFTQLKVFLTPGDKLSIVARVISGAASDVTASLNWDEDL